MVKKILWKRWKCINQSCGIVSLGVLRNDVENFIDTVIFSKSTYRLRGSIYGSPSPRARPSDDVKVGVLLTSVYL